MSMQNLPPAPIYELEFMYMSWGTLINEVVSVLSKALPTNARVLDLICGPGYLLGKLQESRPDVACLGVDFDQEFIAHAKAKYPLVRFELANAVTWMTSEKFDAIVCTGGVHHLCPEEQEPFIARLPSFLKVGGVNEKGFAVIADPYIGDFRNERERLLACAKLGYEYLVTTIENDGPPEVIKAAVDVLSNDLFLVEWKTSVSKRLVVLRRYFSSVTAHYTWPQLAREGKVDYGDCYFLLTN